MTNAVELLLTASTRLQSINHSLQSAVVLLDSIAADVHTNTQQLQALRERQPYTRHEFEELKAMIRQQHEASQLQAATTDRLVRIVEVLIQQHGAYSSGERSDARRKSLGSRTERPARYERDD